jgi:hypothetical protein
MKTDTMDMKPKAKGTMAPVVEAPTATLPLERMKTNVAAIGHPAEKERWEANVKLWQLAMADGALLPAPLAKATQALDTMRANVEEIVDRPEKERWEENTELWRMRLAAHVKPTKADLTKMTALLDRMKANVEHIAFAAERERWVANRDLWEFALRPM